MYVVIEPQDRPVFELMPGYPLGANVSVVGAWGSRGAIGEWLRQQVWRGIVTKCSIIPRHYCGRGAGCCPIWRVHESSLPEDCPGVVSVERVAGEGLVC